MDDYNAAQAPTWRQKTQHFFFRRGLAARPPYLQHIYDRMPRRIYVNHELPAAMREPHSGAPVLAYPRNKIRTTKYTPLLFIPKDLLYQFRKVANTYFLMLVILGAFQVFGVASPGLAAVPLIVIVCITAARDAFEDYKRGASDTELNNTPIHLLLGVANANVQTGAVGAWRRLKKRSSRATRAVFGMFRKTGLLFASRAKRAQAARQAAEENDLALRRVSTVVSDFSLAEGRPSMALKGPRKLLQLHASRAPPDSLVSPDVQRAQRHGGLCAVFKNRKWKDVNVGDFIRVRANEEVPADMVVVSTSDAEGSCFVETKNLDGETNLKNKASLACGASLRHARELAATRFWLECDAPNPLLYSFKGTIHYEHFDRDGRLVDADEREPITNDNVLLRGSTLRNTKWVVGVVVYTGLESKIMLNSGITPEKTSKISRELNFSVIINFVVLLVICFISGLINGLFYDRQDTSRIYFEYAAYASTSAGNGVLSFFVALIIYQSLVPISLYISIEIIKSAQAFFIYADVKMYYERLNFPCTPKSWSISDDLGQIEYIFSDKTGTLTQNVMEFKKCTIDGKSYGLAYTEAKQGMDKRNGVDILKESERWNSAIAEDKLQMVQNIRAYTNNDQFKEDALTFVSNDYLMDTILPETMDKAQKKANEDFMFALALCHTVVTEDSETDPGFRDFKAESPDEAALVAVARDLGIVFRERLRKTLVLEIYGRQRKYELLHIIPFTSARKRMTCVLKDEDGKVFMYTKGADNVIYQRLSSLTSDKMLKKTALHLEDFAKEGLRTLCIASKSLDEHLFNQWYARFKEANASIDDSKDVIIDELNEELERDLILLGGTAIEDRLQQGVPDSISILSNAGLKLWVLTGDRIETAINIGFSCNLLGNDMKLLVVRPENDQSDIHYIDDLITGYLQEDFGIAVSSPEEIQSAIKSAKADHSIPTSNTALIIDGAALTLVFNENEALRQKFLLLGKQCKSVICCRVSPSQKAEVVQVVKNNLQVMTLAIGDGANDVAMIQAANVGVGIAGEEGRQAVMSSDYAIGQFRFLTRLLLVHGRWSYKRLAEMVPCFFYKNVVFTFTCFWYGIYTNFDGSYLYEYTFLMFYNLAFTSLPVIILAVFDQDVSDSVSLVVPQLYRSGILGEDWSQFKFVWYMIDGLYQSVIAYFFPYLMYYITFQNHEGLPVDHRFWIGVLVCAISVAACNIYILLQQRRWDWLTLLINTLSTLVVFFWTGVWGARPWVGEFYAAAPQLFGTLGFWCCFFVGTVICVLPRFVYDFFKRNFHPRDIDIIRERAAVGDYKDYPSGYDPTNIEDIERHRLLQRLNEGDTELLEKIERAVDPETKSEHSKEDHTIARAFKSIKRKTTISRSRKGTVSNQAKYNKELLDRPINLSQLRMEMIRREHVQGWS
ncbi:phospholipid-translocating P-type ATPase [Metschnikowia bicuspidata var. bicuspidata NRRL YB-4993]|uniref:Phospholipid-transporting ATPase n=1 Tax=Metschnikowia bicuspidata var. bicuspidata NRRL YB-4993 TaxID=869754 RepID=A0A1A0HI09_9ASCO|nr:phospholipid-translocating P-type ATPase [Metschnikowia bicuspidata var. bicuspidata NRRL YB-4993]OBA23478.1 phospholipid-translocating P-type ATPase [Metschnikowia bicuspidata var. bicuspidata NRRL YB-4993]